MGKLWYLGLIRLFSMLMVWLYLFVLWEASSFLLALFYLNTRGVQYKSELERTTVVSRNGMYYFSALQNKTEFPDFHPKKALLRRG